MKSKYSSGYFKKDLQSGSWLQQKRKLSMLGSLLLMWSAPNPVLALHMQPSPFRIKSITQMHELSAAFHHDKRFAGADGACSVPIDEVNTLWFFGDTFVRKNQKNSSIANTKDGPPLSLKENAFVFINNSGAVQNVQTKVMQSFWRQSPDGMPVSLLKPAVDDKSYYWPGDGFVLDEKLFLVNKVVVPLPVHTKKSDPNGFNFDWRSNDLLQILDAGDEPANWHWKSAALPDKLKSVLIGTACHADHDFAYFFTSVQQEARGLDAHPTGVSRIAVPDLLAMDMTKFTFWNGKEWTPKIAESKVIVHDGAPEMTVTKLGGEPYLVATYMPPMSAEIKMRFAKNPEGPWSEPITVFECPEQNIKILGQKCSVYSAKAHPEFSDENDEIIVTYCSNPGDMKHYLRRPDLYYPHVIKVVLEATSAH